MNPYTKKQPKDWLAITEKLVEEHPLDKEGILEVCLKSWEQIFKSKIGGVLQIGKDINLTPQMIGNFLHILIAYNLQKKDPSAWRIGKSKKEKDMVYFSNDDYSFEIKTSSSNSGVYGNRSYGQEATEGTQKSKEGYYLVINFDKKVQQELPQITKIRFGWIEHSDWIAQTAPTGQQSRLSVEAMKFKLLNLL